MNLLRAGHQKNRTSEEQDIRGKKKKEEINKNS
jgi:hypothetical protein